MLTGYSVLDTAYLAPSTQYPVPPTYAHLLLAATPMLMRLAAPKVVVELELEFPVECSVVTGLERKSDTGGHRCAFAQDKRRPDGHVEQIEPIAQITHGRIRFGDQGAIRADDL